MDPGYGIAIFVLIRVHWWPAHAHRAKAQNRDYDLLAALSVAKTSDGSAH
jgi:hypothetical protein